MTDVKNKIPKKKVTKKKIEKKAKIKTLQVTELQQISLNHSEQAEINLQIEIVLRDVRILNMQKELLRSQIKNLDHETAAMNSKVSDLKLKKAGKQESHRNYVETLKNKYDIQGGFGYDPATGVLQED